MKVIRAIFKGLLIMILGAWAFMCILEAIVALFIEEVRPMFILGLGLAAPAIFFLIKLLKKKKPAPPIIHAKMNLEYVPGAKNNKKV